MNQTKSTEERLKGLGWRDVTVREKAILQRQGQEGANDLYKAFEHEAMGTVYCYSSKEAEAFLEQLEAHPQEEGIERYQKIKQEHDDLFRRLADIQTNGEKLQYMLIKQKRDEEEVGNQ